MNTKKRGRGDSDEKSVKSNGEIYEEGTPGGDIDSSTLPTSLPNSQLDC